MKTLRTQALLVVAVAALLVTSASAAHSPKLTNAAANAGANAATALLNTGYLRIYDGTQPATADTAVSTQTLCAELRFGATAFGSASAGVATANAITSDSDANATCTATWFRALESDGTTGVLDGSVCATGGGCDIELATTSIVIHATVSVSSLTYTQSKS